MSRLMLILLLNAVLVGSASALDDTVTVNLMAQNDSGQTGTATLLPQGDKTKVVIELSGMPPGAVEPAHIHLGTCDKLDPKPKWPLQAIKDGRSETVVPVPLNAILKEPTAINVHKSPKEVQVYVACGNIIGTM